MLEIVTSYALLDDLIEPERERTAPNWEGLRCHCYRMLNFARNLAPDEPERDDRIAIMAAFHDLPVFYDGSLAYLERAAGLADTYLAKHGLDRWATEMRLMIMNHHKVRRYKGPHAGLVEATRRADWIDVSWGKLGMGIPKSFRKEVEAVFPVGALMKPAVPLIGRYMLHHPLRPLPMMRW